ncbi:muconolactone Delta-isomerase [Arthrobacter sp. R4]|uniref:muconolactone Delta-isomerase n=1 Tax=Arthrobacter sp. R4 TaxID=644417 RepID=UPI003EDB3CDD
MLYLVKMDVDIPSHLSAADVETAKATEKARAQELQCDGRWVHLWRVVGRYSNYSVFDVDSNDDLHDILQTLPLYPYMQIEVTPLAQHPSALTVSSK